MNYQTLINSNYSCSESSSESSSDEEEENLQLQLQKYYNRKNNLIINTIDRDWFNLSRDTFSFQVKFNPSETSSEIRNTYTDFSNNIDNFNKFNRTITKEIFLGSQTLNIPISFKNINSITITKILLPSRYIFLGNSNFVNMLQINGINIVIDEFNNVINGTNNILNNTFSSLTIFTPIYHESNLTQSPNYVEFKNNNNVDKLFNQASLNTINTLTFNFYDSNGNKLKYFNDILSIEKLDFDSNPKYIKITTKEYFYRKNYREKDIIIIKNVNGLNGNIKEYIERWDELMVELKKLQNYKQL